MTSSSPEDTARHGSAAATSADNRIPLLTDVVVLADSPSPASEPPPLDGEWALLAARVEAGVTERLMTHTTPLLEGALQDLLPALLARATAQLTAELRDGVASIVRELVARAVAEELARLRAR